MATINIRAAKGDKVFATPSGVTPTAVKVNGSSASYTFAAGNATLATAANHADLVEITYTPLLVDIDKVDLRIDQLEDAVDHAVAPTKASIGLDKVENKTEAERVATGAISDAIKLREFARTINTANPVFGSVADCTGQGIGTDLAPKLKAAFDYGVATFGNGFTIEVPHGRYRWATPIVLDGQGARNVTIRILGVITTDNVAMRACTFKNMHKLRVEAAFDEGGRFIDWNATLPWYCDYSTTEDVVAAGGQEAFCFDGTNDYEIDINAYGYAGRVVRVTDSHVAGSAPTSAIKGRLKTTRNLDFSKSRTAQAIWADPGTNSGQGNFGNLDLLCNDFDAYPPVFRDWNDIKIGEIDSAYYTAGPIFRGCQVVTLASVYVGEMDKRNAAAWHVTFTSSASRSSGLIQLGIVKLLSSGNGLLLDSCTGQVDVGSIFYYSNDAFPHGTVLEINNTPNVRGKVFADHDGGGVVYIHGAASANIELDVQTTVQHSTNVVFIASDATGPIHLSGLISGASAGNAAIASLSSAYIALSNMKLKKGAGDHLILGPGNNVIWESGSYDGGAPSYQNAAVAYLDTNKVRAV
jgi:hypothetical protein